MKLTPLEEAIFKAEYKAIISALRREKWKKSATAKYLGIDRKTLYNKLRRYRIDTSAWKRQNEIKTLK